MSVCVILQEGLPFLLPHLTKQLVKLGVHDFLRILVEKNLPLRVKAAAAADAGAAATANGGARAENVADQQQQQQQKQAKRPKHDNEYLSTPAVLEQLESVQAGGAVCVLDEGDAKRLGFATAGEVSGALTANAPLAISVWRTRASLSVLVSKAECEQMVEKIRSAQQRVELAEDLAKAKTRVASKAGTAGAEEGVKEAATVS
jgi:hypothetical protein